MFDDFLKFLHEINERIAEYMHLNPDVTPDEILNLLQPGSELFDDQLEEQYRNLSIEYQELYDQTINDIPLYYDGTRSLLERDGPKEAIRRIFEKVAKDEFQNLKDHDALEKIPFQDFIEEINDSDDHERYNGWHLGGFDYEELKKITPEQLQEWKENLPELRRKFYEMYDDVQDERRRVIDDFIKEHYPKTYEKHDNVHDREREIEGDWRRRYEYWELRDKILEEAPEYQKLKEEEAQSWKEWKEDIPGPVRLYYEDHKIFDRKENGIDFPIIIYDEKTGEPRRLRNSCECDVQIERRQAQLSAPDQKGSYAKMDNSKVPVSDHFEVARHDAPEDLASDKSLDHTIKPIV